MRMCITLTLWIWYHTIKSHVNNCSLVVRSSVSVCVLNYLKSVVALTLYTHSIDTSTAAITMRHPSHHSNIRRRKRKRRNNPQTDDNRYVHMYNTSQNGDDNFVCTSSDNDNHTHIEIDGEKCNALSHTHTQNKICHFPFYFFVHISFFCV